MSDARWYRRTTVLYIRTFAPGDEQDQLDIPDPQPVHLKGWQILPAKEIDRVGAELVRLHEKAATEEWRMARHALQRADAALHGKGKRIRSWVTGAKIETCWAAIHAAEAWLLLIDGDNEVRAALSGLSTSVDLTLPAKDKRRDVYIKALERMSQPNAGLDREQLRQVLVDVRAIDDIAHGELRAYRNLLVGLTAFVVAVAVVPPLVASENDRFIPVCAATAAPQAPATTTTTRAPITTSTSAPSNTAANGCPTGSDTASAGDVWVIELFGAVGGLLSIVLTVRRMRPTQAPYALLPVQSALKVGVGALAGLVGVMIMQSGLISALAAQRGPAVFIYAVLFGVAQDSVTRFADQKGSELIGGTQSKNDPNPGNANVTDGASASAASA